MFFSWEVAENLGISTKEIADTVARGFITPAKKADGRGRRMLFSERNVDEFHTYKAMRKIGIKKSVIKQLLDNNSNLDDLKLVRDLTDGIYQHLQKGGDNGVLRQGDNKG